MRSARRGRPRGQGTTIEVRDLFFNTPARRKFQRSEKTELGHVDAVLRNLALARFDVEFRLTSNGRTVFALPAAAGRDGEERRLAAVCGEDFMQHARHLERAIEGVRLRGWLAAPAFSRSQADMQFTYVNDRFVRDKLLRHAVRLGYQDVLFQARQPAYVLHVALDPRRVDVNAHPAKLEIRFRDSQLVHDFVFRTVEAALASTLDGAVDVAAAAPVRGADHRRAAGGLREPATRTLRARARERRRLRAALRAAARQAGGAAIARGCGGGPAAGIRAGTAGGHLRARAQRGGLDHRRHARGARAHHLRTAQGGDGHAAACRRSRCWCRSA